MPAFKGPLVDSHAHLNFPEFKDNLSEILANARNAGITKILSIATQSKAWPDVLALAKAHEMVYATLGIHPCEVDKEEVEGLKTRLTQGAANPKVIGFGETGLDFFHKPFDQKRQEAMLWQHIEAGQEVDLPLVIHTREAGDATLSVLKEAAQKGTRAVIHCFTETLAFAKACLDLDFFISFSGIITFKNARDLQDVVRYVPLNKILVETDAPYLAPAPFRGKVNQPAFTYFTAQQVADLKNEPLDVVAQQTTQNFFALFSKGKA